MDSDEEYDYRGATGGSSRTELFEYDRDISSLERFTGLSTDNLRIMRNEFPEKSSWALFQDSRIPEAHRWFLYFMNLKRTDPVEITDEMNELLKCFNVIELRTQNVRNHENADQIRLLKTSYEKLIDKAKHLKKYTSSRAIQKICSDTISGEKEVLERFKRMELVLLRKDLKKMESEQAEAETVRIGERTKAEKLLTESQKQADELLTLCTETQNKSDKFETLYNETQSKCIGLQTLCSEILTQHEQEQEELKSEIRNLKREKEELLTRNKKTFEKEIDELKRERDELKSENEELVKELEDALKEIDNLRFSRGEKQNQQLCEATNSHKSLEDRPETSFKEIEKLRAEIRKIREIFNIPDDTELN